MCNYKFYYYEEASEKLEKDINAFNSCSFCCVGPEDSRRCIEAMEDCSLGLLLPSNEVEEEFFQRTLTGKEYSRKDTESILDPDKCQWDTPAEPLEVLEVDKKKADITKAKPGQMMEDFNLALLAISEVTRYGIEKYERPGSWKHAHKELMKYKDALGRHLLKPPTEKYDDESGYLHLIQVGWNVLALIQMELEFMGTKPRDVSKITRPIEGLTQEEPAWFKGGTPCDCMEED